MAAGSISIPRRCRRGSACKYPSVAGDGSAARPPGFDGAGRGASATGRARGAEPGVRIAAGRTGGGSVNVNGGESKVGKMVRYSRQLLGAVVVAGLVAGCKQAPAPSLAPPSGAGAPTAAALHPPGPA